MKRKKPEWAPPDSADSKQFATSVLAGVEVPGSRPGGEEKRRAQLSVEEYAEGVLSGDRTLLARAITLVESSSRSHREQANMLVRALLPRAGRSIRIGISGIPGAGKSTFIEAFGSFLCEAGHNVAVLAIDPSSSVSKGSILGDKTRMERLSQHPRSFIRPSPSGGMLGGVAQKTRESMLICEAAGFDVVIVETVGVGQSESTVRSMVDFFMLLAIPGAGDEMQHMKRGILELVDAVVVNKADGDARRAAEHARNELNTVLHYTRQDSTGWETRAWLASALEGTGIGEIWELIRDFDTRMSGSGVKEKRRKEQLLNWFDSMLLENLKNEFLADEAASRAYADARDDVIRGSISPAGAVDIVLQKFFNGRK